MDSFNPYGRQQDPNYGPRSAAAAQHVHVGGGRYALGKDRPRIDLCNDGGTVNLDRTNRLWTFSPSAAVAQ